MQKKNAAQLALRTHVSLRSGLLAMNRHVPVTSLHSFSISLGRHAEREWSDTLQLIHCPLCFAVLHLCIRNPPCQEPGPCTTHRGQPSRGGTNWQAQNKSAHSCTCPQKIWEADTGRTHLERQRERVRERARERERERDQWLRIWYC